MNNLLYDGEPERLQRVDAARTVVEGYVRKRWVAGHANFEAFRFDGRVLSAVSRYFTVMVPYDPFGKIWVNGHVLPRARGESVESEIDRLIAFESDLRLASEKNGSDRSVAQFLK